MTSEHVQDVVEHALHVRCPQCTMGPGTACLTDFPGIAFHHERVALGRRTYYDRVKNQPAEFAQPISFRLGPHEVPGVDVSLEHWEYFTQHPDVMTADVSWCSEHHRYEYYGRVPNRYYPDHPLPSALLERLKKETH